MGKTGYLQELKAFVLLAFASPVFIGPGVLAWQLFDWLKSGSWTPMPVTKGFAYLDLDLPSTDWLGFQKMIDWVMGLPLSVASFLVWMTVIVLVIGFFDGMETRKFDNGRR
jgi:hypothetical protein